MPQPVKRKRGAPLGNRKAVKHGYYAKNLNHVQQLDYAKAVDVSGLDEEIALVRVAVKNAATGGDLKNLKSLLRSVNTLDKLIRTRYRVANNNQDERLKNAVQGIIRDVFIPLGVNVGNSVLVRPAKQTISNGGQSLSNANQSQTNGNQIPDKPKQIGKLNKSKQITENEADSPSSKNND